MATQSVEFSAASGQTVTARLFSAGSDTVVQTASAVVEATNRDGVYTATFTDVAAGLYRLIATNSGGTLLAQWWVDLTLTTATFQAYEMPPSVVQTVSTNNDKTGYSLATAPPTAAAIASAVWSAASRTLSAFGFSVTVGTNNDKTGYSLATAPPTAAAIADAVWDEATAGHTTVGTYGGQVVRSANSNNTVQITGSNHIAADVHEFQPDVLTSDATAASFVTEVQSGLATAAALAVIDGIVDQLKSRSGYTMSILAGAISNAQNAAEAYTITLDGTAYGVTYSGLDSSGNRTGATLTET
jgi:hypothetical protein